MTELSTRYNPQEVEDKWRHYWEEHNLFQAVPNSQKKPFTIVIPPPNVTGILHMGHALNNTLQDILVRYKRMKGFVTLWMPGTDHAGIATQNVVEKQLAKEGKQRQDLGREEFLKKLWEWKRQYGDTIIHQLKKLGASCDWSRARFTMDDPYSQAVTHAFVELYKQGLIYRGRYIINWCPRCQTALSDEEAEHKEIKGHLYHLRYPFKDDPKKFVTVATTRPETMLGDTAVAVNPKDKRYKGLIGKTLILPFLKREIQIITDSFVDPKFASGAVKVTPAHDPNDFAMGIRHKLPFINILHPDARLNENAGAFAGKDRFEGRTAVIEALKEKGLLEKIEPHTHAVGHCYRCHTIIEPYLSKQWFVKMKPLAKPAIEVVKKGRIKFHSSRWTKVYLNWMENIRDWCISRQIWWGHRIPVWYCVGDSACKLECHQPIVTETKPERCPHCGSKNLQQDEDVLDTWFSSWLWPFTTLYWPQKSKDLEYFYPTSALFTAPEIIFFWVARMIMAGIRFMGDIPFSDVYIHGTVRDKEGRKMSKSLGNAIDPLEVIKEFGADALRFSLIVNSGQDIFISKEKFEIGRNFANKIWNASRLVLMNASPKALQKDAFEKLDIQKLDIYSRWIISQLHSTIEKVSKSIEKYRFSEAETLLYDFFWKNFCDWYLEMVKDRFAEIQTQAVAVYILKSSLKLMHPFTPFVTEEIFNKFSSQKGSLVKEEWPAVQKELINKKINAQINRLIEIITVIRNLRSQWNIAPQENIDVTLACSTKSEIAFLKEISSSIQKLGKVRNLSLTKEIPAPPESATGLVGKFKIFIPLSGIIDLAQEKEKILGQLQEQRQASKNLSNRLKNKEFLKKAPPEVVKKERDRLTTLQTRIKELEKIILGLN